MYVSYAWPFLHTIRSKQTLLDVTSEFSGVVSGGLLAHCNDCSDSVDSALGKRKFAGDGLQFPAPHLLAFCPYTCRPHEIMRARMLVLEFYRADGLMHALNRL